MADTWNADELERIGDSVELDLASRSADGSLSSFTTMWVAGTGDDLYVRSAGGPERPWYRRAVASRQGRIRAGGLERDVVFTTPPDDVHADLDAVYHQKYDRYGPDPVGHVTGPEAVNVTIRLVPEPSAGGLS